MKGVTMNKKITALICAPPSCSMAYMTTKTPLDPYAKNSSAGMFMSADIGYTDGNDPAAKSRAVSFIEFDNADYAKVRSAEFSVFLF